MAAWYRAQALCASLTAREMPPSTALYPEVDRWTLICEFGGTAEPLLLAGPDAALIGVMTVLLTHGSDAVAEHPSLQRLG
jgi:hypothetical protein